MSRRLCLVVLLVLCVLSAVPAWAQSRLTTQQLATLKTAIEADPVLAAWPNTDGGNIEIAKAMNLNAAPTFTVWKTAVSIGDVGRAFNAAELAGLSSLNHTRLQTLAIYLSSGVNPSTAAVRAFFDDIFSGSGGANTRAALLALWKRLATRAEKLYATGTGSDASPATLVVEGALTVRDVETARNQ